MTTVHKSEIEQYREEQYGKLFKIKKIIPLLDNYKSALIGITGVNTAFAIILLGHFFDQYLDIFSKYVLPFAVLLAIFSVILGFIFDSIKKSGEVYIIDLNKEFNGTEYNLKWSSLSKIEKDKILKILKQESQSTFKKFNRQSTLFLKPVILTSINLICVSIAVLLLYG